jgi:hypothetical protein
MFASRMVTKVNSKRGRMRTLVLVTSILTLFETFGDSALASEIAPRDGGTVVGAHEIDAGFAAIADAPGGGGKPHPLCRALAKLKSDFDAHTHWTTLSLGQFHFVEGVYVGSPSTPEGLPPGDGALLAQHDGERDGVIVWTRGPLACMPLPIPEKLIKIISSIKTGALDDEGDEL